MTALIPVGEIERMATAVAKSGLFGVKSPDQALALMLVAQAEGLHPAIAARDYHVIQGRPALKADAMLSRFQAAGGKVEWKEYTDAKVVGVFTHAQGGSITVEWSMDMATKAGLTKNPTWRQYPRQMLRARCISEGIRTVFPGVVSGFYSPEEVADFAPPEKDVTPAQPEAPKPAKPIPPPAKVKEQAAAMRANKPAPPPIEGTATVVPDDAPFPPEAGDLNGVCGVADKPDVETMRKVVAAFAAIGYDIESLEKEYGKNLDDWTVDDIPEAREVLKVLKAKLAAEQQAAAQPNEVI